MDVLGVWQSGLQTWSGLLLMIVFCGRPPSQSQIGADCGQRWLAGWAMLSPAFSQCCSLLLHSQGPKYGLVSMCAVRLFSEWNPTAGMLAHAGRLAIHATRQRDALLSLALELTLTCLTSQAAGLWCWCRRGVRDPREERKGGRERQLENQRWLGRM